MTARWITADVFDGLATLEDDSVDLVVTSPPFLALRSYLPADHSDKHKEMGSEATPAEFIDVLLKVTAELRRVLAPHGSICIELGDTYAGSGGAGGDYLPGGWREGQQQFAGSQASMRESNAAHWRQKNQKKGGLANYSDARGNPDGMRDPTFSGAITLTGAGVGWPLAKSRTLIPQLYEIALAYGRNPLRSPLSARELLAWFERIVENMREGGYEPPGVELLRMMGDWLDQHEAIGPYQEYEPWRIRNIVTWARPNPPVGALGDKWRPATSDLIVACVSPKRYWDDLATRKPHQNGRDQRPVQVTTNHGGNKESRKDHGEAFYSAGNASGAPLLDYWEIPLLEGEEPKQYGPGEKPKTKPRDRQNEAAMKRGGNWDTFPNVESTHEAGAPLLDYWEIPPGGYKGSHYAVFPEELVVPCVKAMCPEKVCRTCGEPNRRIVSEATYTPSASYRGGSMVADSERLGENVNQWVGPNGAQASVVKQQDTLGWTDCGHDDYRPGLVLDPFAGSGTTLSVATGHGHDAIGVDLDPRNADLARDRIGPFLFEEMRMQ